MKTEQIAQQGSNSVAGFLDDYLVNNRVHAKSLISTFFGDVVVPNDGFTWVETIAAAVQTLGVNERLVRTTLFRLREEGWLNATRSGRKSYYQLTDLGKSQTELAERLIYYRENPPWDGMWTLIFLVVEPIETEVRSAFEQELSWIGFGPVTRHVWAHPGDSRELVAERIARLEISGKVICMRCENIHDNDLGFSADDRLLADLCSPITEAEEAYEIYVQSFSPLLTERGELAVTGSDMEFLSLRVLILDEFRRAVLRDRHLPLTLLPEDWAGQRAYQLCGTVYRQIRHIADTQYETLQSNAGKLKQTRPSTDYANRFL